MGSSEPIGAAIWVDVLSTPLTEYYQRYMTPMPTLTPIPATFFAQFRPAVCEPAGVQENERL